MKNTITPCELPDINSLRAYPTELVKALACDCFEVMRERGEMTPYLDTDDLAAINAASFLLETVDDTDLEDIYYLIEDELNDRGVFDENEEIEDEEK